MLIKILFLVCLTLVNADEESFLRDLVATLNNRDNELLSSNMDDDALLEKIRDSWGKRMTNGLFSRFVGILSSNKRAKWAPIGFAKQISCYQGRSTHILWSALYALGKYNGYGCYCGGGFYQGNYLDATDLCCKNHDACYSRTQSKYGLYIGCHTYTTLYSVECCAKEKITKCTNTGPSVGRDLCECDQEMARCVAERSALSSYNKSYMKNRSRCESTSSATKIFSFREIIQSCRHVFKRKKEFPQTISSQGYCWEGLDGFRKTT